MRHVTKWRTLLVAVVVLTLPAAQVARAGLIAHYEFDVNGGTGGSGTTPDALGTNYATLGPGVSIDTTGGLAKYGAGALNMTYSTGSLANGADGAVTSNTFTWTDDARTITFWWKDKPPYGSADTAAATYVSMGTNPDAGERFDIKEESANDFRVEVQGTGMSTDPGIDDGAWHFIAVTVPSDAQLQDIGMYVDGSSTDLNTSGSTLAINTGASKMVFGDSVYVDGIPSNNDRTPNGYLDEVRVYDEVLTSTQISNLYTYNSTEAPMPPDGTLTELHSFTGGTGGQSPGQSPVLHDGKLYGVTTYGGVGPAGWDTGGGSGGWGVLYSLDDDGTNYTVLHNFSGTEEGSAHGRRPQGFTVDTTNNVIYGVTQYTSKYDLGGTLYKINTDGTDFDVLHSFAGGAADGKYPYSVLQSGTMLYGVTRYGGDSNKGTVFACGTDGTGFSLLHEFTGTGGAEPLGSLAINGTTLFGVTYAGGTNNAGTLFQITDLGGTPTFLTLKNFDDLGTSHPYDAPVVVVDGSTVSLYGTAAGEWATDDGVVWSYIFDTSNPTGGTFTSLIDFTGAGVAGGNPMGGLVLGLEQSAGQYLFGATAGTKLWGGSEDATIFAVLLDGSGFLTQETFDQAGDPDAITRTPFYVTADPHYVQMYGTSHNGGADGFGTVWYFEAPEPATMGLLAVGGCLALARRRRRRA